MLVRQKGILVNTVGAKKKNWMVIEVCDRELWTVEFFSSREKAETRVNELLVEYVAEIGCEEELAEILELLKRNPNTRVDEEGIQFASEKESEAWCNWHDKNWDAYIVLI